MASAAMALAAVLGATGLAPSGVTLEQPARVGRGVGTMKMQRVAEIALGAGTEYAGGSTWGGLAEFCYNHGYGTMAVEDGVTTYTNSQAPVSAAAIKLADEGYYLLSCRSWGVEVLDIMEPYKEVTKLIWVTMLVGIVLLAVFTARLIEIISATSIPPRVSTSSSSGSQSTPSPSMVSSPRCSERA